MGAETAIAVATAFNDAINRADLDELVALMTPDHRFVDAAGGTVEGRGACADAWDGFFRSFPDYRNEFATVDVDGAGRVVAEGRSHCSVAVLDGPARWIATVSGDRVAEWRVEDPGPG